MRNLRTDHAKAPTVVLPSSGKRSAAGSNAPSPVTTQPIPARPRKPASNESGQKDLHQTARLLNRLSKMASEASGMHQVLGGTLAILQERPAVIGYLLIRRLEKGQLSVASHALGDSKLEIDAVAKWLLPKAAEGLANHLPVVIASAEDGIECVAVPMRVLDYAMVVTVTESPSTTAQRTLEMSVAQTASVFLESYSQRSRMNELSSQVGITAATLELVQRTQNAMTIDEACLTVVAELKEHFRCDQVFIGLTGGRKTCQIKAASDIAVIDAHAESTMAMKAVLDESVGRNECGAWPPLPGTMPHQMLAHKQLAKRDALVISTPLTTRDGQTVGALAMIGRREMASVANLQHFVAAFGEPIGETLTVVSRNQGSFLRRLFRKLMAKTNAVKRVLMIGAMSGAIGVMLCPWPYTIRCQSITEPVERRFCVAPHDGLLETTFAEPGDVVQLGQPLASMDGREILWELASVTAEKHRAEKKRDAHMAHYETPEALGADLEVRALENQKALLEYKESNLEMMSPINGIVLSGSLDRRENYPVTKGQVLYEVAPLDQLRVEVGLPADEVMHVEVGDQVQFHFDGFGTETVNGTIAKIRPRAEIRNEDNVFIAEVLIPNSDGTLRPGMEGIAKVKTDSKMIGWIVFHHAAEKLCSMMPW